MRPLTITALLATVFVSVSSHAQDVRSAKTTRRDGYRFPAARLESAGYRNIEKIEREGGSYEVKGAADQAGRRDQLLMCIPKLARSSTSGSVINDGGHAKVAISAVLLTGTSDAAVMTCPNREPFNLPLENDPSGT